MRASGNSSASRLFSAALTTRVRSVSRISLSSCSLVLRSDARKLGLVLECCGAFLAQIMQIDRVENQPRLRRIQPRRADIVHRDVVTRKHDRIEAAAVFAQPRDRVGHERVIQRLHAQAPAMPRCSGLRARDCRAEN